MEQKPIYRVPDHVSRGGTSTVRLALGTSRKPDQDTGAQLRAEPESAVSVRADMGFRLRRATRAFSDFTFQLRLGPRASSVRWRRACGDGRHLRAECGEALRLYSILPVFPLVRFRGHADRYHARGPGRFLTPIPTYWGCPFDAGCLDAATSRRAGTAPGELSACVHRAQVSV